MTPVDISKGQQQAQGACESTIKNPHFPIFFCRNLHAALWLSLRYILAFAEIISNLTLAPLVLVP